MWANRPVERGALQRRTCIFVATVAACGAIAMTPARGETPPTSGLAVATGVVDDGTEGDGLIWITLVGSDLRFEAPMDALKAPDTLFATAKESARKKAPLKVSYDLDTGFIDPGTGKATFAIREVRLGEKVIAGVATSDDVRRTAASRSEAIVARALAESDKGAPSPRRDALTGVLADPTLPQALRVTALRARANTSEEYALGDYPAGEARDRLLLSALADSRAWSALAPDDSEAAFQTAYELRALGAFDEAIAMYRAILAKHPDQDYAVAVRIGSTYRAEGKYDRALAALDDLVTRKGPQEGMRFHYNRGLTLLKLGRTAEAIKAFDAGLPSQTDYAWAFAYRACALAAEGRIAEALADNTKGAALSEAQTADAYENLANAQNRRHLAEVTALLKQAATHSPPVHLTGLCDDYADWGETPRTRSQLLPPP